MTEQRRDWDKELADIDRVIEKQGTAPQGTPPALPPGGVPQAPTRIPDVTVAPAVAKGSVAKTWFWVGLAVLLAAALPLWPYGKSCGLQLFFYLGAAVLALLAGAAGSTALAPTPPSVEMREMKCWTSIGMSSRRSRSGGTTMGTTLSR